MKTFEGDGYGVVEATQVELSIPEAKPGSFDWLTRFSLKLTGESGKKWHSICAYYVKGVVDHKGNWIAPFAEPTEGKPTKL